MNFSPRRILLVYHNPNPPEKTRVTILQHLRALEHSETEYDIVYYNAYGASLERMIDGRLGEMPSGIRSSSFDAIILHYTFLSYCTLGLGFYKWRRDFDWIRELECLKIAIPQDEGDCPELLDEWLFDLGVSVIFSVHYNEDGPLYPVMREHATIYPCLPGYIDEDTAKRIEKVLLPIEKRPRDIVYRARRLPYRFGKAGRLKYMIADVVEARAKALRFNVDISNSFEDSIYGGEWFDFIASSKTVIGCQGGWSAVDWRGELRAAVSRLLRADPSLSFEDVERCLPKGWDDYRFFTVTPRHFEAIITKTCQLLIEGEYKGILQADKHYIPIKQDFSNLDEALGKLRDDRYMQGLVDRAYEDIYLGGEYTYRAFAKRIDEVLIEHQKMEKGKAKAMSDQNSTNKLIAVLERQLIAERHQNALVHAGYQDMVEQVARRIVELIFSRLRAYMKRSLSVVGILALVIILVLLLLMIWL
jgi:hypothetical protein